jgi:UDP-2,4-diacetamido-2,4,6-trideoxy-beta-L-altropyranose hydrolase
MRPRLLIRCDASAAIGTGHVMRCLALALAWRNTGGEAIFLQAGSTPALDRRLAGEKFECHRIAAPSGSAADAAETCALAQSDPTAAIVADGYRFDAAWQRDVKRSGVRLLVIDDYGHAGDYSADVVLNQNASASAQLYARRAPETKLLLGTRYALLRPEFSAWKGWQREIPKIARKVLVTLGGSDPDNVTALAIEALSRIDGIEAVVAVGGSNPQIESLKALVARHAPRFRVAIDAPNMGELMAWADIAVAAGGSTSWELAYMGLPAIVAVLADNQAEIAAALARRQVIVNLGDFRRVTSPAIEAAARTLLADSALRSEMSRNGRELVDGHGARRVAAALGARLRLAFVSDEDSWLNAFLPSLKEEFEAEGHEVCWLHDPAALPEVDIAFLLSLSRIVQAEILRRNAHNLVVHESALPEGRGWSPLTWQVIEGREEIPVSLIEAGERVDSGDIYAQKPIRLTGNELVSELREQQAAATLALCRAFVGRYPFICDDARPQAGAPSYYPRRRPADSRLDPDKTLREQFNLLRVADPDRYPAFFELAGRRYEVRLTAS